MSEGYRFEVLLSNSAMHKLGVPKMAARLQRYGVRVWTEEQIKPGDSIPTKIEEGLVLGVSIQVLRSDWAQLEADIFEFRDPLNRERRIIPLRLDDGDHDTLNCPRPRPTEIGSL
jgi:TIR domain-containing protein